MIAQPRISWPGIKLPIRQPAKKWYAIRWYSAVRKKANYFYQHKRYRLFAMTAIEHRELRGITIRNLVVTVVSTASIVASVMTTYFGLKTDIREIKTSQATDTRINNIRLKILEDNVALLQKEVDEIKLAGNQPLTMAKQLKDR